MVIIEESSVYHDWIELLSNLISLREIWIPIVLSVELNELRNSATECERATDSLVQAVFVENWECSWDAQIYIAHIGVWLMKVRT
jgi:hypothetical protein